MLYEGIILTGTSCAGKSTLAQELCRDNESFQIVRAITTRSKRSDDFNYEYCTEKEFKEFDEQKQLLIKTEYRSDQYGIMKSEYEKIIEAKKIPILILTPKSSFEFVENNRKQLMIFFVDALDEDLSDRYCKRQNESLTNKFFEQTKIDRKDSFRANYIVLNKNISNSMKLIMLLWEHRNHGGGLSQDIIGLMLNCGMLLKNADSTGIKGASYDLLLGDEYYYAGKIEKLSDYNPFLTIEPYDYAIVSCKEIANMPRDVIAKFGLSVGLFCQGIILSNGPQIDPGFQGTLFCLLFNTSNRAVHLKRGKHYATIEFNKLIEPAQPYSGQYQNTEKIIEYIPANALQGGINELKKEIEKLQNESKFMQNIYLGVVGLMFALISLLLVFR